LEAKKSDKNPLFLKIVWFSPVSAWRAWQNAAKFFGHDVLIALKNDRGETVM
jgi:hypothetical protein